MYMRQYLSTLWGVVGTLASLILAVVFTQVATSTPAPPTSGLYGCVIGITNDVNGCGVSGFLSCDRIGSDQPAPSIPSRNIPGHGEQCIMCQIWQIVIRGQQHFKTWRDCNNDNVADCEYWYGWFIPKCIQIGKEIVCEICVQRPVE